MNNTIDKLKQEFKGYHLEIMLFPSGGIIEASGCSDSECGTEEGLHECATWGLNKRCKTIEDAVDYLKSKLRSK